MHSSLNSRRIDCKVCHSELAVLQGADVKATAVHGFRFLDCMCHANEGCPAPCSLRSEGTPRQLRMLQQVMHI